MKKLAVIGGGYWGKNLVRNFHQLGVLKAVCDSDQALLEKFSIEYADIDIYSDFSEVLSSDEIESVAISLPAAKHYEFAKQALDKNKDVFVEKPLALDVEEAEELIQLANQKKKILMVGHLLQYHSAFIKLRQMIEKGELGRIQYIYSNRLSLGKIRREENALWSFAPHDISMILSLTNEMPDHVSAEGGNYLHQSVADVTTTHLSFPSGIKAHVFVSWLHPFKEQKLIVVAEKQMAVFEDTQPWDKKIALYPHSVNWQMGMPIPEKADPVYVAIETSEPLAAECKHFVNCVKSRKTPLTDGEEGLRVLQVLDSAQKSLKALLPETETGAARKKPKKYFVHESAFVDEPSQIGDGTKIWHYTHVLSGARIGKNCILGQNVNVANDVTMGDNVKVQNNVSIYTGTIIEDDVFLGPSCVLTNVSNPRSQVLRHDLYEQTLIKRGATVGANATIVCGTTIGRYAFIAAGAVVTKDVPDYAFLAGIPARRTGWMSRHGHKLENPGKDGIMKCPESGLRYKEIKPGTLRCLDLDEEKPLPEKMATGKISYRELKKFKS